MMRDKPNKIKGLRVITKKQKKVKKSVDIVFGLLYTMSCVKEMAQNKKTGCGSAWLERLVWDQEVAGSNPVTPTQYMRVQFNGRTLAFQARYVGSIPITRF